PRQRDRRHRLRLCAGALRPPRPPADHVGEARRARRRCPYRHQTALELSKEEGLEMARSSDRILTSHVGSLVRPPQLVEYIEAIEKGLKVDMAAFDALLQQSVNDVVRRQQQAGIDIVSDGEYGKFRSWSFYV